MTGQRSPLCCRPVGGLESLINVQPIDTARSSQAEQGLALARRVASIADDYRGKDTLVLDMTKITPIVDYFVLTTGTSKRQMQAIAEEVDRVLKSDGSTRIGREGYESNAWILLDYGDVVLHVFTPEARELYDLEHLWADAAHVEWQTQDQEPTP